MRSAAAAKTMYLDERHLPVWNSEALRAQAEGIDQ
jgi:hypothetical protein